MKKKLIIAILILVITVSASAISQKIVHTKIETIISYLEEIENAIHSEIVPIKTYAILNTDWNNTKKLLQVFVTHDKILIIENNIVSLSKYFSDEYLQTARKICIDTICILKTLQEETSVLIENVL